jgi:uroporphyrinogen-III synthase
MIVAIRPEPGLQATLQAGRAMHLTITGMPLFTVEPLHWDVPDPAEFSALLIGSANAIRHGGPGLQSLRSLPVHAVGQASAEAARAAGFTVAATGSGGLQALIDGLKGSSQVLRLAGREHVPLDPADGISITTAISYEVRALPLAAENVLALRAGDPVVLLHSASAARHFADECARCGLDKARIALACIGQRVAVAAGGGWRDCQCAPQPSDSALLALARDMCH